MTRRDIQRYVFIVEPARIGGLWQARLQDDRTVTAQGESPMLAIRNLAVMLEDEDAASADEHIADISQTTVIVPAASQQSIRSVMTFPAAAGEVDPLVILSRDEGVPALVPILEHTVSQLSQPVDGEARALEYFRQQPSAATLSVRQVAELLGIGKSTVSRARQKFLADNGHYHA